MHLLVLFLVSIKVKLKDNLSETKMINTYISENFTFTIPFFQTGVLSYAFGVWYTICIFISEHHGIIYLDRKQDNQIAPLQ